MNSKASNPPDTKSFPVLWTALVKLDTPNAEKKDSPAKKAKTLHKHLQAWEQASYAAGVYTATYELD